MKSNLIDISDIFSFLMSAESKAFKILYLFVYGACILVFMQTEASGVEVYPESDSKKSMMTQIENDLSRERDQFLRYESKEKGLLEQLAKIEEEVGVKRDLLKGLKDKISSSRKALEASQNRLNILENSLVSKEDQLGKRLVAFYKYAKKGYLQVLATANDLDHLNHSMKYLTVIMEEDRRAMEEIMAAQKKYKDEMSHIEDKLTIVAGLEKDENEKLFSIRKDLDRKVVLLAKIHQEKEFYETAVKELQSAAQNLKGTILRLEKNQKELKELPTGFDNVKGKLPFPLKGSITKSRGKQGDKNLLKGIYIDGTLGENVRAVYPGRVEFSGQLKGYGQIIVINHGARYFTISAHLSGRDKAEGDVVSAGDVIGQVGETGLSSGPGLYFEIREGGTNHNPLAWLKVN
jgi:septal ring factor EnvC (AmiA/AmiB activator)